MLCCSEMKARQRQGFSLGIDDVLLVNIITGLTLGVLYSMLLAWYPLVRLRSLNFTLNSPGSRNRKVAYRPM